MNTPELVKPILHQPYKSFDHEEIKVIEHNIKLIQNELDKAKTMREVAEWETDMEIPYGEYTEKAQYEDYSSLAKLEHAADLAVQLGIKLKAFVNRSTA